ncbi:hypothetical protein F5Y13DRAFT_169928 [Hypoxylon sp. FL1857]|nr:hypothetical protein F5Y13DRAFT_169928 [Hypoxylon sp. FL1857]
MRLAWSIRHMYHVEAAAIPKSRTQNWTFNSTLSAYTLEISSLSAPVSSILFALSSTQDYGIAATRLTQQDHIEACFVSTGLLTRALGLVERAESDWQDIEHLPRVRKRLTPSEPPFPARVMRVPSIPIKLPAAQLARLIGIAGNIVSMHRSGHHAHPTPMARSPHYCQESALLYGPQAIPYLGIAITAALYPTLRRRGRTRPLSLGLSREILTLSHLVHNIPQYPTS